VRTLAYIEKARVSVYRSWAGPVGLGCILEQFGCLESNAAGHESKSPNLSVWAAVHRLGLSPRAK